MFAWATLLVQGDVSQSPQARTRLGVCRCGHERVAHEHYRAGSDCALCPDHGCRRYAKHGVRLRLR